MVFWKTSLNVLDILSLFNFLRNTLINAFFNKVYRTEIGYIFRFRKGDDTHFLLIDIKGWIFLTQYIPEEKKKDGFVSITREKLTGKRLLDIKMPFFDRYLKLEFEDDLTLYVEFMEGGNIVLTKNNEIIAAAKTIDEKKRRIKSNTPYIPPVVNEFNPLKDDFNTILPKILNSKGNIVATLWKFAGIPPEIVEESCLEENIDKRLLPKELPSEKLEGLFLKIKEKIKEYVYESKPCIIIDKSGFYENVINHELVLYKEYNKKFFDNLNSAIEDYFFKMKEYQIKKSEEEKKIKEKEKKEKVIEKLNEEIEKIKKENENIIKLINIFKNNFEKISKIFEEINKKVLEKKWEDITNTLTKNWDTEWGKIKEINLKDKIIEIEFENTIVELNLLYDAMKNINLLFNKIKENKTKINKIEEKMKEMRISLKEEKIEKTIELKKIEKKKWYENYLWFFSSNRFLIIAGRDSTQNEALIKRRTEKDDMVFHADIHGSPFLLLKTEGKEVSEKDILEAAQFVASYSSAWKEGLRAIDVYWVKPEQISKKAPSGTYLTKGSFMIYGKKNYLKNVPLALAILIDEEYIPKVLPEVACSDKDRITIVPGRMTKEEVCDKIISLLKSSGIKLKEKEFREALLRDLPKGGFEISYISDKFVKINKRNI